MLNPYPGRVLMFKDPEAFFDVSVMKWVRKDAPRLAMVLAVYPDLLKKRRHSRKTVPLLGWDVLLFWLTDTVSPRCQRIHIRADTRLWTALF